jgi:hypothetical protein
VVIADWHKRDQSGNRRLDEVVACGSECTAWQDFVADTYKRIGMAPWAAEALPIQK